MSEIVGDRIFWIPLAIACTLVLAVFVSISIGLGVTSYNVAIVWDYFGEPTTTTHCEYQNLDKFVHRPLSASFSFIYILFGFHIITQSVTDVARMPELRSLYSLLQRETYWGVLLGMCPVLIGFVSFFALASSSWEFEVALSCMWWITINMFSSYAWARFFQYYSRNFELGVRLSSWPSVFSLLLFGVLLNVLLLIFRNQILPGQVLLVSCLCWNLLLPLYLHWKWHSATKCSTDWSKLVFSFLSATGSVVVLYFSSLLCLDPTSVFQPYCAFQFLSAFSVWHLYRFLRSDHHPLTYRIIVQNQRDVQDALTTAFIVPQDDPYFGSSTVVEASFAVENSRNGGGQDRSRSLRGRGDSLGSNEQRGSRRLKPRQHSISDQRDSGRVSRGNSIDGGGGERRDSRGSSLGEVPLVLATSSVAVESGNRLSRASSVDASIVETSRQPSLRSNFPLTMAVPETTPPPIVTGTATRPYSRSMDSERPLSYRNNNSIVLAEPPLVLAEREPILQNKRNSVNLQQQRAHSSTTRGGSFTEFVPPPVVVRTGPTRPSFTEVETSTTSTTIPVLTVPLGRSSVTTQQQPPMLPPRNPSLRPPNAAARAPSNSFHEDEDEQRPRSGSRSNVVPGRSRRSSTTTFDPTLNPALRVLDAQPGGSRTIERERALTGEAIDSRMVHLRTPEEAQQRRQSLLIAASSVASDPSVHSSSLAGSSTSTEQRLENLRQQRAKLQQRERGSSFQ